MRSREYPVSVVVTEARITCPECGFKKDEEMPRDACQHFYRCARCDALTAAGRRLLRVLLVLGSALPADAGGLGLAERAAFGLKPSLVLGRHRRMESPGDVPAKRAAKGAALTDALRRAAAAKAGWVVYASDEAHGRILRREGSQATNDRNRRSAYRSDFLRWADTAEIKPGTLDFLFEFTRLSERQGAGGASAQVGAPERAG